MNKYSDFSRLNEIYRLCPDCGKRIRVIKPGGSEYGYWMHLMSHTNKLKHERLMQKNRKGYDFVGKGELAK